jgi:hypothetical protein
MAIPLLGCLPVKAITPDDVERFNDDVATGTTLVLRRPSHAGYRSYVAFVAPG